MPGRQIKLQPESVMADVRLGVTVAGLYTLVGMGLIIAFMRRAVHSVGGLFHVSLDDFTSAWRGCIVPANFAGAMPLVSSRRRRTSCADDPAMLLRSRVPWAFVHSSDARDSIN